MTRAGSRASAGARADASLMSGAVNIFSHPPSPGGTGRARARDRGSADGVSSLGLGLAFVAPTGNHILEGAVLQSDFSISPPVPLMCYATVSWGR